MSRTNLSTTPFPELPGRRGRQRYVGAAENVSNGSFYLATVYGTGPPYTVTLFNGQPVITTVDYVFQITNDAHPGAGWRYYTVVNTIESAGFPLVGRLDLSNQVPGTEIAILQKLPCPASGIIATTPYNYTVIHPPDTWIFPARWVFCNNPIIRRMISYIGIYTPASAPGKFVPNGSQLTGPPVNF